MAVATKYVVIRTTRENEEQEVMTFTDKRAADDYDKMLDMADAIFELLHNSDLGLEEQKCEELSIFLAKDRDSVLEALQAKKKPSQKKSQLSAKKPAKNEQQTDLLEEEQISPKSLSESLILDNTDTPNQNEVRKSKEEADVDADESLVDFVIEKDEAA